MQNTIPKEKYLVITFNTTTQAYKMEKLRRADNLDGRLIPLPKAISAGCGASFATKNFDKAYWSDYMNKNDVEYSAFHEIEL